MSSKGERLTVLYVVGASRSGSTILSNLLGEIEGCFHAGELIELWDGGITQNGMCGCGLPVIQCGVWKSILEQAFGSEFQEIAREMISLRDRFAHSRSVPMRMVDPFCAKRGGKVFQRFQANLHLLYQAIRDITNCDVLIDSSKNSGYAYILSLDASIDLRVLHLIRDARATAYSWLRKKRELGQVKPVKSSLQWNTRNVVAEMLGQDPNIQYLQLHYEDFVADPKTAVQLVLRLVGKETTRIPFVSDHEVQLGLNHTVIANPNRFLRGVVRLNLDDEWQGMRSKDRWLVNALTWPLLLRYGYLSGRFNRTVKDT